MSDASAKPVSEQQAGERAVVNHPSSSIAAQHSTAQPSRHLSSLISALRLRAVATSGATVLGEGAVGWGGLHVKGAQSQSERG